MRRATARLGIAWVPGARRAVSVAARKKRFRARAEPRRITPVRTEHLVLGGAVPNISRFQPHRAGATLALGATLGAALASCAGGGAGLDASGRPVAPGGSGGGPLTADFASIQAHVLTPICTVCHAGAGAPQGLRLDATNSYALLVGVPSNEVPAVLRVKPGDPGNSYLVQKLEGHAAVGARMPFGGPYLDDATIAVIRQWITDGAARPAATGAPAPLGVATVAPAPGDVVAEAPRQLVVEFTAALDETRLDAGSLRLERLGTEGTAPEVFALELSVTSADGRTLRVVPREALAPGRYRLVASGAPQTGIASLASERLGAGAELTISTFTVGGTP
jgi:hypothetical protein